MTTIEPSIASSGPASSAPMPGYTVGVVAERLGVPTATLRSWSQRYELGPHGHLRGRHRLYSEADIAVLMRMLDMVQSGVSPASAAQCVKQRLRLTETDAATAASELVALAQELDTVAMSALLSRSLQERGVVETWTNVCCPAFALVVEQQVQMACIDDEHALSWAVSGSLRQVIQQNKVSQLAKIMLVCTPGERHLLPLEALAAALAESAIAVRMLGSDLPIPALRDALERTRPAALVLWSQLPATADLAAIDLGLQFAGQVFVAGPGWPEQGLPEPVIRLTGLAEASIALARAVTRGFAASE